MSREKLFENAPLFKKTSTGAIQRWENYVAYVDDIPTVVSEWGQINGKVQVAEEKILVGKNIGKKNETTPLEQARLQMEANWTKRLKKGYVKTLEDAVNDLVDALIKGGIVPMTANVYQKQGHKIVFPAIAQPKLDGHRSTSQKDDLDVVYLDLGIDAKAVSLWSRGREQVKSLPHICKALSLYCPYEKMDGELYNHDYRDNFEDLTSLIKQDEPIDGHEVVEYHVYDIPHPTMNNFERYKALEALRPTFEGTPIKIVESIIVNNPEELTAAYIYFMELGYEGAMVRNFLGLYVNKKSYDLQKYKEFEDDEFEIVDINVSTKGKMAGKGVFICITKEGKRFKAKMKGKISELKKYADNPEDYIGKQLTVQFQGYTKKNNVPRFPVALRIRVDI